eukprot:Platyproteum_vivax@DN1520_c0_g1_i1.p1
MKLFSAVVLSFLFCFVKSLKSSAIRTHLKNVSAHGEAIRARTGTVKRNLYPELQNKVEKLMTETAELKQQVDSTNADVTPQNFGEDILNSFNVIEWDSKHLQEEINRVPDTERTTKRE